MPIRYCLTRYETAIVLFSNKKWDEMKQRLARDPVPRSTMAVSRKIGIISRRTLIPKLRLELLKIHRHPWDRDVFGVGRDTGMSRKVHQTQCRLTGAFFT